MQKQELDEKITEVSKSIFSYCVARTSSQYDAEDLAQDIVLEIYRSAANIRDDKAFYGFMWAVAGNVYKQWCRKRQRTRNFQSAEEISEGNGLSDPGAETDLEAVLEENSDIRLLRRELALLSEKYRRATILYYLEEKSCLQIADILSVSESMVKYLLFKSRQIVRKGMDMERDYGEQSYNPREFAFYFWGDRNHYDNVCGDKLTQNILFACYNDKLNAERISLEIGVGLPYLEDRLKKLCDCGLLVMEGGGYYSDLIIFTREFQREAEQKTCHWKEEMVRLAKQAVLKRESDIRKLGFWGADRDENSFRWQIICMLLRYAIMVKFEEGVRLDYPVDVFGSRCFRWGVEKSSSGGGQAQDMWAGFGNAASENESGCIRFMDFAVNGRAVHPYFFGDKVNTNILLDIAANRMEHFSENDRLIAAEFAKKGWIIRGDDGFFPNLPVFTEGQMAELLQLLDDPAKEIAAVCDKMREETVRVLRNHVPVHLKKQARQMPYFYVMGSVIPALVRSLYEEGFLHPAREGAMLPTTCVVLKE